MRLLEARVLHFKSIDDSGAVTIDPEVTVIVGQNEAGKTAFLQALEKARPVRKGVTFDVTEDYPRKAVNEYRKNHQKNPAEVVRLTFELTPEEVKSANEGAGADVLKTPRFTFTYRYDGSSVVNLPVDEAAWVKAVVKKANLPTEISKPAAAAATAKDLIRVLEEADRNAEADGFLESLKTRFKDATPGWSNTLLAWDVWHRHIGAPPRFLYFGDYQLLPGKVNLTALQQRVANGNQLSDEDQTVLRLLKMADVELQDVLASTGYEETTSRLEGLSNSITDQIFEFWTQNRELDVKFDVRADPTDPDARFQNGPNLYIRIWSRRHRVSVPFSQRSKGFIWFFSFLVWFDSVMAESGVGPVILLLDEPGLSLHALAQGDLLRYIDNLSERHQVLYTTHSPFMVHGDRLHQVRLVEDRKAEGTVVTDNVMGSDPKTVFPLQAALGYTVAQNLFISKRNLLVEGPADLVYLKVMSAALEARGRAGLRDDVTIIPAGGLDKVATFVALLGGNQLEVVVVHDLAAKPDARLESMVREKVLRERHLLNYGMFRTGTAQEKTPATDVEDLFAETLYLDLFNGAYSKELNGKRVEIGDLPNGDRIVERIERYLKAENVHVRPSGGFNHYAPATWLASNPPASVDDETLNHFEALFQKVNALFSGD